MKLLNQILNKISSKNFNKVCKSTGALSLIASAMSNDQDILNSFCVLAFDEVPNKNFSLKEYVSRKADSVNGLNLVQKHLIAKEVSKYLKDASAFYDSELTGLIETQADFKRPESVKLIKSAHFGDVAFVNNKYHLVNPITKNVTAEFIVAAADANFAKLHELIGEARKAGYVDSVVDLDGDLVVTTRPNVSYELANQIKELGYDVEEIDQTNYEDTESVPTYNLRIKMSDGNKPADIVNEISKEESVNDDIEKSAEEKIDFEKDLMEAGESGGAKDKVNETQLAMGKEVEKEHTTNPEIAEKITRDHLEEIPDYYTHLKEMEENAKKNDEVKSSYAPFITIDATKKEEIKIYSGDHFIGTCKTIQAAFEKSSNEFAYDGNEGARTTHKIYEDEKITITAEDQDDEYFVTLYVGGLDQYPVHGKSINKEKLMADVDKVNFAETESEENPRLKEFGVTLEMLAKADEEATKVLKGGPDPEGKAEAPVEASTKPEVKKEAANPFEDNRQLTDPLIEMMKPYNDKYQELWKQYNDKQISWEELSNGARQIAQEAQEALQNFHLPEPVEPDAAKKENIEKKADDQELKQFDMKQELDGQKEFEKQDDFSQVSVPEEKEDTSEVTETMEAKPEETKGESFSASEFGNNLAYIQQNNPDAFKSIMNNLKQIMVGDEQKIYNFLENWASHNFQDFTAMTREDPTYARHSQYQEQLKNNVLPKLKEMSEYKQAMEEKVSAEKGNVEASVREYDSSDPEDAAVYNHNGEDEGEED